MGGGDQSEAHSALIHVDAHLILITKMQFPGSQSRLIGSRLCKCFFAQCLASSRMDGFHTDRTHPQADLFHRHVLLGWNYAQQTMIKANHDDLFPPISIVNPKILKQKPYLFIYLGILELKIYFKCLCNFLFLVFCDWISSIMEIFKIFYYRIFTWWCLSIIFILFIERYIIIL